jgi:hypothetical protein
VVLALKSMSVSRIAVLVDGMCLVFSVRAPSPAFQTLATSRCRLLPNCRWRR